MSWTIRPISSRHLEALAETFPERSYEQFEQDYLDHLQEKRFTLVADFKEEDELFALGYATVLPEAPYTWFWQRRIPELVALAVGEPFQRNGIGTDLIATCERDTAARGYTHLGISLVVEPANEGLYHLLLRLGYQEDGAGITPQDHALHLFKAL
jgi:ribosomal protein S18 acetylase RimI-like enzyme